MAGAQRSSARPRGSVRARSRMLNWWRRPALWPQSREDKTRDKYYQKWLDEDVTYIITDDEKAVFSKLQTPEERDAFIEQFWRRRD